MKRLVLAACLFACSPTAKDTACPEARERVGRRVCVHEIEAAELWREIAREAAATDQVRSTVFLLPARPDARLPPLLVDASSFDPNGSSLHFQFLTESFPEFALLEPGHYLELVLDPARREFYAGSLTEYADSSGASTYGFTVADSGTDLAATVSCSNLREVAGHLEDRVRIGDVAFVAQTSFQRDVAAACDVRVFDPNASVAYEVYTPGAGCGTVKLFSIAELRAAEIAGTVSWQDIVVVDEAPLDLETIVSAIVTGSRQGELSHLNVRSSGRGTPNCYVRAPRERFDPWAGELVRVECGAADVTIEAVSPAEAQSCWDDARPPAIDIPAADLAFDTFAGLLDLPTVTATERGDNISRFGSKGSNLAALYQRIPAALRLSGFVIPFHYYAQFMAENSWTVDLGAGPETLSFSETVSRLLADPAFLSSSSVRRARLEALRDAMRASTCDPALVAAVGDEIRAVFAREDVMVRFRSSSNAEDALGFNGAGLYDSTSVCLADELDADSSGPSRCDPDQPSERSVCRGLTKVWASLWNMRAFEEREWYRIDHASAAMGILVNTRAKGELANVVAFTGNPFVAGDDRFLVNAQDGELAVVSSLPGVWPEKDLLTIAGGSVVAIERARGSTELPVGQWVLSDGRLNELGAALHSIAGSYPVDDASPGQSWLLDSEWKMLADGRLIIKQVRPFLD